MNTLLLAIENSKIHDNQYDGIRTVSSNSTILNSLIHNNGSAGDYYGINFLNPSSSPDIFNNTIVCNSNEGIRIVGSIAPDIHNNILWYNNEYVGNDPNLTYYDQQLAGNDPNATTYNCIYDYVDPNNVSSTPDAYNNIYCEPGFAYRAGTDNFHLAYDSPCKNQGTNSVVDETNDVDMDSEDRIYYTTVDIGADEVYACSGNGNDDIYNVCDVTSDGIVNLKDFDGFSKAWLDSWTGADVNDIYDTAPVGGDDEIDIDDFAVFATNWLWHACWKVSQESEDTLVIYGTESAVMMSMPMMETVPVEQTAEEKTTVIEEILIFLDNKEVKKDVGQQQLKNLTDALESMLYELEEDF